MAWVKKFCKVFGIVLAAVLSVPLALYCLWLGTIVFCCMTFGSGAYLRNMETEISVDGRTEKIAVYKARGKPYLLVGPYLFSRNHYDFFFVGRNEVIRTATSEGGSCWVRFFFFLFILDDLSGSDSVRMPYWDDLENDPNASVSSENGRRTFSFRIRHPERQVIFSIPEKLFTRDMENADNFTKRTHR
ncbi:MAG: hypothetical protein IJS01_01010 [Lentisphaeria bacterium]|nr:hypothetical protein [Lentisphaeria bacterium]